MKLWIEGNTTFCSVFLLKAESAHWWETEEWVVYHERCLSVLFSLVWSGQCGVWGRCGLQSCAVSCMDVTLVTSSVKGQAIQRQTRHCHSFSLLCIRGDSGADLAKQKKACKPSKKKCLTSQTHFFHFVDYKFQKNYIPCSPTAGKKTKSVMPSYSFGLCFSLQWKDSLWNTL